MDDEHYGHTCPKCPSRGLRSVVGDFAPVNHYREIQSPQGRLGGDLANGVDFTVLERAIRWMPIGFPERCTTCNERYARFKRAREAIHRLEMIRQTLVHNEWWLLNPFDERLQESATAPLWRFLRFITLTWPLEQVEESQPDLDAAMRRYLKARDVLAVELDVRGGTDVMECVSKQHPNGRWTHNIHFHGVWLMPYHPIEKIAEGMKKAGVGRDQVRTIRPVEYECRYTGETRTMSAISRATAYLAKYLTKEVMQGRRRIVWGELRRWKESIPEPFRCPCIKSTHAVWKSHEECAGLD